MRVPHKVNCIRTIQQMHFEQSVLRSVNNSSQYDIVQKIVMNVGVHILKKDITSCNNGFTCDNICPMSSSAGVHMPCRKSEVGNKTDIIRKNIT